ncbi:MULTISPECIES: efflux RND transporter periplasmic adaptor subunit [unclassified Devosia]|uniref:efflux RND transporter periplasmic adaptor subunit n=1 Tax=unclassified Devosia TaxID=196773 RepID=UPI000FD9E701|nr:MULTISPECIES: efflux RND transporter periplasmic adaptor subunit [unclassified Devosia]
MAAPTPADKPDRKRRWSWWQVLLVVAVLAVGLYAALARPWEPKPAPVAVENLAMGPFSQVLAVNGRVVARETVTVRSAVSALAVEVLASEGDLVAAGDVLVQLETSQPQTLVGQAQAALDAGMVSQAQAKANADRAIALGENATRSAREDAELALSAATNEVARLQAALEQAQSQLKQYTIVAPLTGTVLDRNVDRGQLVDPQTELFIIADIADLQVETDIDELYSSRIRSGLKALLKPVGDTVPQHGSVVFASPTVDPATGGRPIKLAFDQPVELPVGLTINANIIVSETDAALTVPRGAIVTEGTDSHVLVLEDGVAMVRPIEFSDWPAQRVIVTAGLDEGDQVILDPTAVQPGQSVVAE